MKLSRVSEIEAPDSGRRAHDVIAKRRLIPAFRLRLEEVGNQR